jgi:N-methylhydantoinase A
MRYRGQGHEIAVPFPAGNADPATLRTAFDTTYTALFGRTIPRLEIEVVTWTLALAQRHDRPERVTQPVRTGPTEPIGTRRLVESATGCVVTSHIYTRKALDPGTTLIGPAVILEDGTTTIVPTAHTASIGADREIIIEGPRA